MKKADVLDFGDLRKTYKSFSKNRFKVFPNKYRCDRWLFQFGMFLVFGWLLFVCVESNWQLDYFECVDPSPYSYVAGCDNPFYKPITWKNVEVLPVGVYGNKPGVLFNSVFYAPLVILGLVGFVNHLFHNRGG
jgi:hypothetical protein